MIHESQVYGVSKVMHVAPWVLDPDLPHGGLYWVSRANLFESVSPEVERYFRDSKISSVTIKPPTPRAP